MFSGTFFEFRKYMKSCVFISEIFVLPQGSGIFEDKGTEGLYEPVVVDDFKKAVFSRNNRTGTHTNSQQLSQHAEDLQKLLLGKNPSIAGRRIHHPAAGWETMNYLLGEGESVVSVACNGVTLLGWTWSRAGLNLKLNVQHKLVSMGRENNNSSNNNNNVKQKNH